jgi:hypothetical protein
LRDNRAIEGPQLSVVAILGPERRRAGRLLDALGAQSAAGAIEAVLVDLRPEAGALSPPEHVPVTIIDGPPGTAIGEARSAAFNRSRAPIVAFLEDHCYPAEDWAEGLLATYRGPWGAVGYAFENANPETYASRATFLAEYAWWLAPAREGPAHLLPNVNVSYRREVLQGFGSALPGLLELDFGLQEALRRRGVPMTVAAGARARHETMESLALAGRSGADYGRLLAARRARQERWGILARLLYAGLTPIAAPWLRVGRLLLDAARQPARLAELLVCLPGILLVTASSAVGEAAGYALGEGNALAGYRHAELEAVRARGS